MRLKSIKLAGFKSFVDPTTVPFQSNMTAIVGPNGCGKSNVIDAVRWVMGESSAKHLRGESMTDVIFNGSVSRKPVSRASIELVFDNTEGRAAGEYAKFAEIAVKREVTRDGQSKYFLNGSHCRRRDVTDLFLGTGLGPRSYAIIEQGMIARIIEAKPEELRTYVEEAAGVSKYKERRRETESRILRTRENLDRLNDLSDELGRQLDRLKRQADAAERYKTLKAQSRDLESLVFWYQLQDHKEKQQQERVAKEDCQKIMDQLASASQQSRGLVVIADDVDGEALSTLVVNKMRGILNAVAIKAPDFGDKKKASLEDIAILTGGTVVSKEKGQRLEKFDPSWLGEARKITVTKDTTTIIDGKGTEEALVDRLEELKERR